MFTNMHIHLFSADHTPPAQLYFLMRGAIQGAARALIETIQGQPATVGELKALDRSLDGFGGLWPAVFDAAVFMSKVSHGIGLLNMPRFLNMLALISRASRAEMRQIFSLDQQEKEYHFLEGLLVRISVLKAEGREFPFRDALAEVVAELYVAHEAGVQTRGRISQRELWDAFKATDGSFTFERVVPLSVDFDHAFLPTDVPGLGTSAFYSFDEQVAELAQLVAAVNGDPSEGFELCAFLGVDPRAYAHDAGALVSRLARDVGRDAAYRGMKLYPPMGFLPSDSGLSAAFEYCQDHGIPVLSHCSSGGAGVRGTLRNFGDYAHPNEWIAVLDDLASRQTSGVFRLCLAHFDRLEEPLGITWCDEIMTLMERYLNHPKVEVYTDISFDVVKGATPEFRIYQDNIAHVRRRNLEERVLFGSDWWNYLLDVEDEADFREYLTIGGTLWNGRVLDEAADAFLKDVADPLMRP